MMISPTYECKQADTMEAAMSFKKSDMDEAYVTPLPFLIRLLWK